MIFWSKMGSNFILQNLSSKYFFHMKSEFVIYFIWKPYPWKIGQIFGQICHRIRNPSSRIVFNWLLPFFNIYHEFVLDLKGFSRSQFKILTWQRIYEWNEKGCLCLKVTYHSPHVKHIHFKNDVIYCCSHLMMCNHGEWWVT